MLGSYLSFLRISIYEARRVLLISDLSILRSMTLTATGVSKFLEVCTCIIVPAPVDLAGVAFSDLVVETVGKVFDLLSSVLGGSA